MSARSRHTTNSDTGAQNASRAQRTAEAKSAFTASLAIAGDAIDAELLERAKNIHSNEKALSKQEKDMLKDAKALAKQSDTMKKFVTKSNKQLASFDDVTAIQADLDRDLADLEEMLQNIEAEKEEDEQVDGDRSFNQTSGTK